MNQSIFVLPSDMMFEHRGLQQLRTVTVNYMERALEEQKPKADHKELLLLSCSFLKGKNIPTTFQSPATAHHAKWVAKTLYSFKILFFQSQVQSQVHVTARDAKVVFTAFCCCFTHEPGMRPLKPPGLLSTTYTCYNPSKATQTRSLSRWSLLPMSDTSGSCRSTWQDWRSLTSAGPLK